MAVGLGMPDVTNIYNTGQDLYERGYRKVSPYFIPRNLINISAGHISIEHGFKVSSFVSTLYPLIP